MGLRFNRYRAKHLRKSIETAIEQDVNDSAYFSELLAKDRAWVGANENDPEAAADVSRRKRSIAETEQGIADMKARHSRYVQSQRESSEMFPEGI